MVGLKKKSFLIYGNIITFIFTILINILANILPLNGSTTGEISDKYSNLFVPANYVFSIWGVIYLLLIIFIYYQALPINREKEFIEKISVFFIITNFANSFWIIFWHYELLFLSLLIMILLLFSLIIIYWRLNIGLEEVTLKEKFTVQIPFSVYLSWIMVATVANVAAFLVSVNWNGGGIEETFWTIIVLLIATIITLIIVVTRKDIAYSLVAIWAFIGILIKQIENTITVSIFAGLFSFVILMILILKYISGKFINIKSLIP